MTRGQERAVLAAAVAAALALVGAQGWSLRLRLGDGTVPVVAAAIGSPVPLGTEPDLAPILAFAPFGRAEQVPEADSPPMTEGLPDLTLLGITLAANAAGSRAILGLPDGTAESVGAGQALPGGATLVAVHADHVVIRTGDAETALRFPTDTAAPDRPAAQAASGPDLVNLIPVAATGLSPLLTGIRMAMSHDPEGYIAGLGLRPEAGGYRVLPDLDEALLQAGLVPGDLVALVNGLPPGDPARDLDILDTVASAGTAILQVTREGQSLTLTVPLE